MPLSIRAITLDLDDTLWPFAPIGERVERVLHAWLLQHCPRTAQQYPAEAMRELRARIHEEHPHLAHDLSGLRKLTLARAMELSGDDPAQAEVAFEAFFIERNRVEFYEDVLPALERLAARVPLAALSNGNADLTRIGVHHHFAFQLGAFEHGTPKPAASIFHAACTRLSVSPHEVLHVGDDIDMDVVGAHRAGLRSCWLNRTGAAWPHADVQPDLQFTTLAELADWLDAAHSPENVAA